MSEEEKIQKFFRGYLTENNIKEDFAQQILKKAQQYEAKDRSKNFLARFYDVLKKCYDGKNNKIFITACKRFLYILHKLVGGDSKKEKTGKYPQIISQQIVQYYLFIFEIIFKHSLHDLIIDLKMYRMKWVRRISDLAFHKLRQQVFKKHKFNLDKGFSEQNMEKLKKIYQKRGMSQKQCNYYLGIEQKDEIKQTTVSKKSDNSSSSYSSDSQNESSPKKKSKHNEPLYPPSNNFNRNLYNLTPPLNNFQKKGYENPQIHYSYDNRSIYNQPHYNQYPYQNNDNARENLQYYQQNYADNHQEVYRQPEQTLNKANYGNIHNIPQSSYYPPHSVSYQLDNQQPLNKPFAQVKQKQNLYKQVQQPRKNIQSNIDKIIKIRQKLRKNMLKCRQCGKLFQTQTCYDKHMTQHFFSTLQKVNESDIKLKIKKDSNIFLFDLKSWEQVESTLEKQYKFEVLLSEIKNDKDEKTQCYFCNENIEVDFSPKYQNWVYSNAIKIMNQGEIRIMHYDCYECFKSDENSPAQQN